MRQAPRPGPRVLSIHGGADTGGQGYRIARAFDGSGWDVRSIVGGSNYIEYPRDLDWSPAELQRRWRSADVLHLHNTFATLRTWERRLGSRPLVIQHHGTLFRSHPQPLLEEQRRRRAIALVSTLDLWLLAPQDTEWLPAPYDMAWLRAQRRRRSGPIRIAHAPTDRKIKSTDLLIRAVARLQADGVDVVLDLIEGQRWAECLRRKARADLFVDQLILGYGNNAIEAWGMGIPVIAGGAPRTLAEMRRRFGELPFYQATKASLEDALRAMIEDPKLRRTYARRGQEFAERFHAAPVVREQLKDAYRRAYTLAHGSAPRWAA